MMKDTVLDLSFQDYLERMNPQSSFQEQLVVIDLNDSMTKEDKVGRYPMQLEASSLILVVSGEMQIEVDYLPYTLKRSTVMQLLADNIIGNVSHTPGFRGYLLLFSPELKQEIMSLTSSIRLPEAGNLKRLYPEQSLTDDECAIVLNRIERIKKYIADSDHLYRATVIKNEVINLLLDITNSRWKKYGEREISFSRNEIIRQRFHELLLGNCRKHRDVGFYAQELCVTPDYLSKIIRECDEQSALKWITNAVVTEAKLLLRRPDMNVSQVAIELNFPDQSTFGKFFKRNTGMAPARYRADALRKAIHYT